MIERLHAAATGDDFKFPITVLAHGKVGNQSDCVDVGGELLDAVLGWSCEHSQPMGRED